MQKKVMLMAPVAAAMCLAALTAPSASADSTSTYQATLKPVNGTGKSGTFVIWLNGSKATINEDVTGLAATYGGSAYPHVQHIHGDAKGVCPTTSADTNKDGVISTTEGAPSYGGILTTLSTSGDTSPASATNLKVAPTGAKYDYTRTFTMNAKTIAAIKSGTAVVVVHGLDPSKLSKKAQGEMSDIVPSLPLAATSPTLCGTLVTSQMTSMPHGAVATGGGSTSGVQDQGLLYAGGSLLLGAGALLAGRRRFARR